MHVDDVDWNPLNASNYLVYTQVFGFFVAFFFKY